MYAKIDSLRKESLDIPVISTPFSEFEGPNIKAIEKYNDEFNNLFFKSP